MAEEPLLMRAGESDIAYYAQRRWGDDESRRIFEMVASSAPNGTWIAKDEGTPIGVAVAHANEDEWFLSELFVEPSFRGNGIGTKLLQEVARDARDVTRAGMLDPQELGGVQFFLRRGVPAQTPLVRIAGELPREEELARMAAGDYRFSVETIDVHRDRAALHALDREVRGTERPLDHGFFAQGAQSAAFRLDAEFVGYVYVWPSGRIGPLVAASQAYLVQLFAYALAMLQHRFSARWCTALVPGTNVRVLRAAVRSGLRVTAMRVFATDASMRDLSRYVGYHELLF